MNSSSRSLRYMAIAGLVVGNSLLGCSDSPFDYAPVSGTVTLDGEPVSNARVVFMPRTSRDDGEAGPYSNGETDSEGRFQLKSVSRQPREGAVVGSHRVIITTRRAHLDPNNPDREIIDAEEIIPRLYSDYTMSPLEFEVPPEGSDSANFDLVSRPPE